MTSMALSLTSSTAGWPPAAFHRLGKTEGPESGNNVKNETQQSHFKVFPSFSPPLSVRLPSLSLPAELKALNEHVKWHHLQGMGTTQMCKGGTGNLPPIIQLQAETMIHMWPGWAPTREWVPEGCSRSHLHTASCLLPFFSAHSHGEAGGALRWLGNSALTRVTAKSSDQTSPRSHHRSSTPSTLPSWDHTTHHATTLPLHLLSLK